MNNVIREMQEMATGSQTTITITTTPQPNKQQTVELKAENIFVKNEYYLCCAECCTYSRRLYLTRFTLRLIPNIRFSPTRSPRVALLSRFKVNGSE